VVAAGVAVRGVVVSAEGAPVEGARLGLERMNEQWRNMVAIDRTVSGADGRFSFGHVPDGIYAIEALAPGSARRIVRYSQGPQPITMDFFVEGGVAPPEQRVVLSETGEVRGRVLGVAPRDLWRTNANLQAGATALSESIDALGVFLFEHVPPATGALVTTWSPQLSSDPFTVEAGKVAEIVLDAAARRGFAGVVEDEAGRAVADAFVHAFLSNMAQDRSSLLQSNWGASRTDARGRFHVPLAPWAYEQVSVRWSLVALHPEYGEGIVADRKLPPRGETDEVRITLPAGGKVSGRVEFGGGGPAADASVMVQPKRPEGPRTAESSNDSRQTRYARADLDGRFEIAGLGAGRYVLTASHP
ncbi:MAG: carboxypeptidase regulatory-like domain-containing protein, partial [Planctomycetota bacterium]